MLCIMSVGQCCKKPFLSYCSGVRIVYFTTSVRAKQASSGFGFPASLVSHAKSTIKDVANK